MKILLLISFGLFTLLGYSNQDSTQIVHIIEEVEISASKAVEFTEESTIQRFDQPRLVQKSMSSLANLLTGESMLQIRSYGPGGNSGISIRGGGAPHTSVIWNGVNLSNAMNSECDLASLPVFLIDYIEIQQGGISSMWGNGSVTGTVVLGNKKHLKHSGINILSGIGSFGEKTYGISGQISQSRLMASVKYYHQSAYNDFKFKNTARFREPVESQTNAGYSHHAVLQQTHIVTGKNSSFDLVLWFDSYDKDIQTLMTNTTPSRANQKDKNIRTSANWTKFYANNNSFTLRSSYLRYDNRYLDPSVSQGENLAQTIMFESENKLQLLESLVWLTGISQTYENGRSLSYSEVQNRNRTAWYHLLKYKYLNSKMLTSAGGRIEQVNLKHLVPSVSFYQHYQASSNLLVHSGLSYNYRFPSFNDLYWGKTAYAEGNPNLKPEYGWNLESGIKLHNFRKNFELHLTGFLNTINDRIIWLPDQTGKWIPENKKQSRANGLESKMIFFQPINSDFQVRFSSMYSFTRATIKEKTTERIYHNKTLIYVPEHAANGSATLKWKQTQLVYLYQYNGKRMYDHIHSIPGYHLSHLELFQDLEWKDLTLKLSFRIGNLWNEHYQVMAWYAMPGRNYQLSLLIQLSRDKHK